MQIHSKLSATGTTFLTDLLVTTLATTERKIGKFTLANLIHLHTSATSFTAPVHLHRYKEIKTKASSMLSWPIANKEKWNNKLKKNSQITWHAPLLWRWIILLGWRGQWTQYSLCCPSILLITIINKSWMAAKLGKFSRVTNNLKTI